jgi:photosystem II stability/assembly factor-like uncharacterized protein
MKVARTFVLFLSTVIGVSSLMAAGSNTWTGGYPGPTAPAATVVATDPSHPGVVYAAFDTELYRSADAGRTWTRRSSLNESFDHVLSLFVSPASTLFAGLESGLRRSADAGASWNLTDPDPFTAFVADPSDPSVLYAGSERGTVFRGTDDGASWQPTGRVADFSDAIASLLFGNGDPGTLYAAGSYDVFTTYDYGYGVGWDLILRSSGDHGATWNDLARSFPLEQEDHFYVKDLVAGASPHELLAAMGNAAPGLRIVHSTDGGATWDQAYVHGLSESTDFNRLVVDPARPGNLYGAASDGVYRSTDDGKTWLPLGHLLLPYDVSVLPTGITALALSGRTLHAGSPYGEFDLDLREGAVDVSAGRTGTHLLSWKDERLSVRTLPPSGDPSDTPPEGPFGGWTAVAIADGGDGKSRVLWANGDGRMGLEIIGSSGSEAAFHFAAQADAAAVDVSVGADGTAHVLWRQPLGAAFLSSVDSYGRQTGGPTYGPYASWNAVALADGSEGTTWILWRAADGRVSLSAHRGLEMVSVVRFDAAPGWAAEDIAVGIDGRPRLLRVSPDGRAEVATVGPDGLLTDAQVQANSGSEPLRIAAGPDGLTRLLWADTSGTESVTVLNADNTPYVAPSSPPPGPPPQDSDAILVPTR